MQFIWFPYLRTKEYGIHTLKQKSPVLSPCSILEYNNKAMVWHDIIIIIIIIIIIVVIIIIIIIIIVNTRKTLYFNRLMFKYNLAILIYLFLYI